MRVIGGVWSGLSLDAPQGRETTRPTTDRVRESLTSMVLSASGLSFAQKCVLDCFAGSGALGIEFLSRGAQQATFVDSSHSVCGIIKKNLKKVKAPASSYSVVCADAAVYVSQLVAGARCVAARQGATKHTAFDIVLLDPPYDMPAEWVQKLVEDLHAAKALASDALIVYECASKASSLTLSMAELQKSKRYGTTCVDLFRVGLQEATSTNSAAVTDSALTISQEASDD